MSNKQTEALKLALEALEDARTFTGAWPAGAKTISAIRDALAEPEEKYRYGTPLLDAMTGNAEQPAQQECNHCGGTGDVSGEYPGVACPECSGSGVQVKPEFFTHSVEQPYDWSDWVCPDPKSYLMKCCDCGLVHEAQFGVVRYKSETEREDCDMVDDPNLQAVFRMRRSEQWSPKDMAYRPGGLPLAEQPAQQQEPFGYFRYDLRLDAWVQNREGQPGTPFYTSPPASKPLTDEQIEEMMMQTWGCASIAPRHAPAFARAIEAKLKEKNA